MSDKYKLGQYVQVINFGKPVTMIIIGVHPETGQFKCGYENAPGSDYYSEAKLDSQQREVDRYYAEGPLYWQNNGPLGPTGHGPDICMSDADPGL